MPLCSRRPALSLAPLLFALLAAGALPARAQEQAHAQEQAQTPEEGARSSEAIFRPDLGRGRVIRGVLRHRILHFTFDDGPRTHTTPQLLDDLDRLGVRATFFIVARNMDERHHPRSVEITRDTARRGHTLGLHGYDHQDLSRMDDAALRSQLERSEQRFMRTFGARPWLVRPPFGARNEQVDAMFARYGYTEVLWNVSFHHAEGRRRPVPELVEAFRVSFEERDRHPSGPGFIIVLHDTHEESVQAFPQMVEIIRARNCELLALEEQSGEAQELWDIVPDLRFFIEAREPGRLVQHAAPITLPPEVIAERQRIAHRLARGYCRSESRGGAGSGSEGEIRWPPVVRLPFRRGD